MLAFNATIFTADDLPLSTADLLLSDLSLSISIAVAIGARFDAVVVIVVTAGADDGFVWEFRAFVVIVVDWKSCWLGIIVVAADAAAAVVFAVAVPELIGVDPGNVVVSLLFTPCTIDGAAVDVVVLFAIDETISVLTPFTVLMMVTFT